MSPAPHRRSLLDAVFDGDASDVVAGVLGFGLVGGFPVVGSVFDLCAVVHSVLDLCALAAARGQRPGTTRVLAGDLAMLHNAGVILVPQPEGLRPHVFVGNDGGGTILDDLEVAATAHPGDFTTVMRTQYRADFAALAAAGGWRLGKSTRDDARRAPARRGR